MNTDEQFAPSTCRCGAPSTIYGYVRLGDILSWAGRCEMHKGELEALQVKNGR